MQQIVAMISSMLICLIISLSTQVKAAQPGEWVNHVISLEKPVEPEGIPLSASIHSNTQEGWAQQDTLQRMVYNIQTPSLVPLTSKNSDIKPAILVIPGGGFQFLAIDNEGYIVAKRLQALGFKVFILKYRTIPMQNGYQGFHEQLVALFQKGERSSMSDTARGWAQVDAQAAIEWLHSHAEEWHLDTKRIGVIGFSAGAITVLQALNTNKAAQIPSFAAMIYGPTEASPLPSQKPPLFAALAADDRFFKDQSLSLIDGWRKSGSSVEFHLYSSGGHGFASQPNGTTSDGWFDAFAAWVRVNRFN